jgi:shikimate dehydrogenase
VISDVPDYPRAGHRAAVIGHPVAHSLSPVLHRAAYLALGRPEWRYEAIDVDEPGLAAFLGGLGSGWAGLSLTMPLKRAIRPLLVRESELARDVGAVNTVLIAPDGLEGYNTDVHGIVEAFGEGGVPAEPDAPPRRAVVLGGGATAASALAALRELGCAEPVVHVRSAARSADLRAAAGRLGVDLRMSPFNADAMIASITEADLVVCTLPAGVADALVLDGLADAAKDRLPVLLDVVYDPWPTGIGAAWARSGAVAVGGFVMLVHQAYGQVHLMTGLRPPVAQIRAAGELALAARVAPPAA